jgi:hypothetical protein
MSFEPPKQININTGVSIGIAVLMGAGFWKVIDTVTIAKGEITARLDKVETRVSTVESSRNSWTSTDMFKWAVHLQQNNPSLKVPEPEIRQ